MVAHRQACTPSGCTEAHTPAPDDFATGADNKTPSPGWANLLRDFPPVAWVRMQRDSGAKVGALLHDTSLEKLGRRRCMWGRRDARPAAGGNTQAGKAEEAVSGPPARLPPALLPARLACAFAVLDSSPCCHGTPCMHRASHRSRGRQLTARLATPSLPPLFPPARTSKTT